MFLCTLILIEEALTKLLQTKFEEPDFEDCFIYEINFNVANNKLVAYIDSDSYLDFKKCQKISRYLESYIDEEGWLGEKYTLEVSSPGLDKPLKFKRQYIKNIGRTINVKTNVEEVFKGELTSVREEDIIIVFTQKIKEGKKKKTIKVTKPIRFDDIAKSTVEISFK